MKPPAPGSERGGPLDKTLPTPDPSQVQLIRSYGPGHFLIGEREWRSPVLVTPSATLKGAGMALEVVDTGSACRIYNVLLAEGRRVAAALIPV